MRWRHTRLEDCQQPGGLDRLGQPLEAVADDDAPVGGATVFDLGQDLQPELGALTP